MHVTRLTIPNDIPTLASRASEVFSIPGDAQVNPVRAAEILTTLGVPVAPATLAKWRCVRSDGPSYSKIATGRVVYRVSDLRRFAGMDAS